MKKILAFAIMAIMTLGAFAQSDLYVGGSVGFWRNSDDNNTELQILPEIGYNLGENIAIGTVIGYDYTYTDGFKLNLVVFNPYLRYSFLTNDRVRLFVDCGVDLGFGKSKVGDVSSDTAVTYGIGIKPGISYALSDKFSVVAHLGFLGYQGGNDASHAASQGGLALSGNDLSIGLYYNF